MGQILSPYFMISSTQFLIFPELVYGIMCQKILGGQSAYAKGPFRIYDLGGVEVLTRAAGQKLVPP